MIELFDRVVVKSNGAIGTVVEVYPGAVSIDPDDNAKYGDIIDARNEEVDVIHHEEP